MRYGTMGSLLSLVAQATIHCGDTWPQPWSVLAPRGVLSTTSSLRRSTHRSRRRRFREKVGGVLEVADDWRDEIARLRA